jgi:GAF domain-containing protein
MKTAGGAAPARRENECLRRQVEEIRRRFQEMERENEVLLNLHVSSAQLHATISEEGVLAVVREILLNLVGADVFAVWLRDLETGAMAVADLVDEAGIFRAGGPALPAAVWEAVRGGEPWFAAGPGAGSVPLCCVPLTVDGRPAGALGIFRLLSQKEGFTELDRDLLGLLAAQAGACLIGARAYARWGLASGGAQGAACDAAPAEEGA